MYGKFYAVGIGPGDPELLTIKAVKTIEMCDIIVLPDSKSATNIAFNITKEYIKNKEIAYFDMPMTKDKTLMEKCHNDCANHIEKILKEGKNVGFLTLGDPCIYSTAMYIHKLVTKMGFETKIISGITSFCATAAALNTSLCEKNEMLHIIPATFSDLDYAHALKGNKILMKSGKTIGKVKEKFKDKNAMAVECATMENEKIYSNLQDLSEDSSYFSIVFVKERNGH